MKRSTIPREEKIFLYDYGNGYYKLVKGCFRASGWVEDSPIASKVNDKILSSSSSLASRSRARSRIFELARCNDFEYFFTQTFDLDLVDRFSIDKVTETIQYYFKYYKKYRSRSFKYLIVAEFHKDKKAIHIHGLISGVAKGDMYRNSHGYYNLKFFQDKMGVINSISPIKDKHATSCYITKYITKDNLQFSNRYYYMCSRGLNRASVTRVVLPKDLENWKQFDYVKICDIDLNDYEKNDNIKESERSDIISMICAKDYNNLENSPILDCVKLRFSGILTQLSKEKEER